MISINEKELANRYFVAENNGDVKGVVDLFDSNPTIKNAANPPITGPDAARQFCEDFYARTERRHFEVLAVAREGTQIYAWWNGTLTFKSGVKFGDVTTHSPFSVTLQGVCRFELNPSTGKIKELDIFHETTTAAKLAREHA